MPNYINRNVETF